MIEVNDISPQKILFKEIQLALAPLLLSETITRVVVWNSQTENEAEERPYKYPYVGIDIGILWSKKEGASVDGIDKKQQSGIATIMVHHVFEDLKNETDRYEDEEDIRHQVFRALDELDNDDYFGQLMRVQSLPDNDHERVVDLVDVYECDIHSLATLIDDRQQIILGEGGLSLTTLLGIDNVVIRTGKEGKKIMEFRADDMNVNISNLDIRISDKEYILNKDGTVESINRS